VDFSATEEDLQAHFKDCGVVRRITIMRDKFTLKPKG
jgi:RNA recognition motif-containing protein